MKRNAAMCGTIIAAMYLNSYCLTASKLGKLAKSELS